MSSRIDIDEELHATERDEELDAVARGSVTALLAARRELADPTVGDLEVIAVLRDARRRLVTRLVTGETIAHVVGKALRARATRYARSR